MVVVLFNLLNENLEPVSIQNLFYRFFRRVSHHHQRCFNFHFHPLQHLEKQATTYGICHKRTWFNHEVYSLFLSTKKICRFSWPCDNTSTSPRINKHTTIKNCAFLPPPTVEREMYPRKKSRNSQAKLYGLDAFSLRKGSSPRS